MTTQTIKRPTPETDAKSDYWMEPGMRAEHEIVRADFARALERQRDEAREELAASKNLASKIATILWETEMREADPTWSVGKTLPEIIAQIDVMMTAMRYGLETERDELNEEVARMRGVLEIIADPNAELPKDGRTRCRIYEDMALEEIDNKGVVERTAKAMCDAHNYALSSNTEVSDGGGP